MGDDTGASRRTPVARAYGVVCPRGISRRSREAFVSRGGAEVDPGEGRLLRRSGGGGAAGGGPCRHRVGGGRKAVGGGDGGLPGRQSSPKASRVRFLEDTDGDGKYDKSTVFMEGVRFPNGILPWRKGVIVTAAPEIFYAEDSDGDGKADKKDVLYSGFTEGNPQLRINGLRWGLDNWVYLANGWSSRGKVKSLKTGKEIEVGAARPARPAGHGRDGGGRGDDGVRPGARRLRRLVRLRQRPPDVALRVARALHEPQPARVAAGPAGAVAQAVSAARVCNFEACPPVQRVRHPGPFPVGVLGGGLPGRIAVRAGSGQAAGVRMRPGAQPRSSHDPDRGGRHLHGRPRRTSRRASSSPPPTTGAAR